MAFLPPTLRQRYFNAAGEPLAGGKIWSYQAGTTTPLPTFTDKTETTQNANPYILDANGEGQIWLGSNAYKIVLMDADDVVQWTTDNVRSAQNATFEAIQPLTTKGQIVTHTGVESTPRNVGSDDQVLTADSADTTGLAWRLPHPLTAKGDVFTRGTAIAARLPVGTNGQVIRANSSTATGLEWQASDPLTTKGDIFVRNASASTRLPVGTDGQTLVADSATAEGVKWAAATGGGGAENYIPNPSAENNTTGWTLNNITPSPFPQGALLGGPAGLTLTRSTSNPLNGVAEFQLAKDGVNRQGQMVLANFTVPIKSRAKVLSIRFPYRVVSGTFVNSPIQDIASLGVYIREFDGTNYTWTEPSSWRFFSNSTTISDEFRAEFQTLSTTISADLVFYVGAFATGAWTIEFDDVNVGPSNYIFGTPITDWAVDSQVSIVAASGTNPTFTTPLYLSRRVGDSKQIKIVAVVSAAGSAAAQLIVNVGGTIDPNKSQGLGGTGSQGQFDGGSWYDDSAANKDRTLTTNYFSATQVGILCNDGDGAILANNIASPDRVNLLFEVPITGWSSSVQMSDQNDGRTFSVSMGLTTSQAIASATPTKVNFDAIDRNTHGTADTTNKRITATTSNWYRIHGQINIAATAVVYTGGVQLRVNGTTVKVQTGGKSGTAGTESSIHFDFKQELKSGDYIEIWFEQGSGSSITIRSNASANQLSVLHMEIDGNYSASIAGSETVAAKSSIGSASGTLGAAFNNVTFSGTISLNTHGAWNGTTFTVPIAGHYQVNAGLEITHASTVAGNTIGIAIYKGANRQETNSLISALSTVVTYSPNVSTVVDNCVAGDTITIRSWTNGTTPSFVNSFSGNYVSIFKI